jgi:hypothetical protein
MTKEQHIARHVELHSKLDELVADYILHTEKTLSETTVMQLLEWSATQLTDPTEED